MFGAHTIFNCNKIAFSSCAKIVKKQPTVSADKISSNLLFVITREKIISFFVWKNMKIQYLFSASQYPPMKIWQQLGHRHLLWTSWKIPIDWNKIKWQFFSSNFSWNQFENRKRKRGLTCAIVIRSESAKLRWSMISESSWETLSSLHWE